MRRVYLNPDTGRFNRPDPWAGNTFDPQSLHKYAYAHCDPVTRIDPSGRWALTELLVVMGLISLAAVFLVSRMESRGKDPFEGGRWRVAFVLDQGGSYRELYALEAAELNALRGSLSEAELIKLRGELKAKYQALTPAEVEAALKATFGDNYQKRTPTGEFNPGKTNEALNRLGTASKILGRVFIVLMLYSEYQKVVAADDWERQLGSSGSGLIGAVAGGSFGGSLVGGGLGAIGANPVTVAVGAGVGGLVGGIIGYDLFSGTYEAIWDIYYDDSAP